MVHISRYSTLRWGIDRMMCWTRPGSGMAFYEPLSASEKEAEQNLWWSRTPCNHIVAPLILPFDDFSATVVLWTDVEDSKYRTCNTGDSTGGRLGCRMQSRAIPKRHLSLNRKHSCI